MEAIPEEVNRGFFLFLSPTDVASFALVGRKWCRTAETTIPEIAKQYHFHTVYESIWATLSAINDFSQAIETVCSIIG